MRKQGIRVRFNTNVTALAKTASGIAATLTDGSVEEYDVVMFATGASPAEARSVAACCRAVVAVVAAVLCVHAALPAASLLAVCPDRGHNVRGGCVADAWGRAQAAHRDAELCQGGRQARR